MLNDKLQIYHPFSFKILNSNNWNKRYYKQFQKCITIKNQTSYLLIKIYFFEHLHVIQWIIYFIQYVYIQYLLLANVQHPINILGQQRVGVSQCQVSALCSFLQYGAVATPAVLISVLWQFLGGEVTLPLFYYDVHRTRPYLVRLLCVWGKSCELILTNLLCCK